MRKSITALKAITEDNFIDAFNLKLAPGQEAFVSHTVRSLAQAYVYRDQCRPFGIYAESRGFSATGAEDEDEIELAMTI